MISIQEAIDQFKAIIGTAASWARLASSQFVEHLAIFQSWSLRDALWKIERAMQEFFLSTALNDSSIMAHAEDREYLPRRRVASTGTVRITNNGINGVAIPMDTPCVSDPQTAYLVGPVARIPAGGYADALLTQLVWQQKTVVVDVAQPFYEVLLSKEESVGLVGLTVSVDGVPWAYARAFRNTVSDSQVYDEFFSHTGQTGIRFGNGLFGAIPQLNTVVLIDYYTTDGATTLLDGQPLSFTGPLYDDMFSPADVTMVTTTPITGGGAEEGIEEMRQNLHYWPLYNDKLIWDDDYAFYLKRQIANIIWIKCWGEEQQEAESGFNALNINRIFISAYVPAATALGTDILASLASIPLLNRKFTYVEPVFALFTITVTGIVSRTVLAAAAAAGIRQLLEDTYGKDALNRQTEVSYSYCYDLIRKTGYFDGPGARFEVNIGGITTARTLNEMVHLDPDTAHNPITLTVA